MRRIQAFVSTCRDIGEPSSVTTWGLASGRMGLGNRFTPEFAATIYKERAQGAEEDRARDQTFE